MDHPHLIACATRRHVVALLKHLLIAESQRPAGRSVHDREENNIALIALELRGRAAQNAMALIQIRSNVRVQQSVDFKGLVFAD